MTVRMGKEFQGELPSARAERERLLEKNKRLRQLLTDHGIRIPATQTQGPTLVQGAGSVIDIVSHASDSKAKIALFRNLFRGREDVYAVRWENPDGRAGYMPKADRDWKAYYASRPEERKKVDRKTRTFRPLTDEVIRQHLAGEDTVGIYPCYSTKHAGSWPWTSTRRHGRRIPPLFLVFAKNFAFHHCVRAHPTSDLRLNVEIHHLGYVPRILNHFDADEFTHFGQHGFSIMSRASVVVEISPFHALTRKRCTKSA